MSPPTDSQRTARWAPWLRLCGWLALLAVVIAAAYLPAAWQAGYVHDDGPALTGHPQVQWPVDWPQLMRARYFGGPEFAYVFAARPLTTLSFAAEIGLGLDSPQGRHAVQLGLLLAVALLAGLLLRRWLVWRGRPVWQAELAGGLAALLFAVHPVHTETVMAIAYRPELLAALGLMMGTHHLFSLATGSASRIGHSLGVCLWGLAALFSKESALAGLVWWALWPLANRSTWPRLRTSLLPIGAALVLWLSWRLWALGTLLKAQVPRHDNPLAYVEWQARMLGGLDLTGRALGQLLVPLHLAPDYTFDAWPTPTGLTAMGAVGLVTLLAALAWVKLHWLRSWLSNTMPVQDILPGGPWLLGLGLLGCWLPVSHLLTPGTVLYADRLLTLPSLLLAVAVAAALARLPKAWQLVLATALLVPAIAQTRAVAQDWQTSLAVFERGVRLEPQSLRMRLNLAHELTLQGRPRQALPHAQAALNLDPGDPKAWVNGLDAALAAKDCAAAEPFVAAIAGSDKKAPAARLASLAWGMECKHYLRAWAIARRVPTARLQPRQALDLYALAHAAADPQGAKALAQRLGVDPEQHPAWASAGAFGEVAAGRSVQAITLLAEFHQRRPEPSIRKQAQAVAQRLTSAADRAAIEQAWPGLLAPAVPKP